MHKLAIFASGAGTNTAAIIQYFNGHPDISIELVVSNNPRAGVLEVAKTHQIPTFLIDKECFYHSDELLKQLEKRKIDFIVLAGFLWLIPDYLLKKFSGRMINVHPALLPKYGGKGMYGNRVHEAVATAGENETGITVHYVNENYDEGEVIAQVKCQVSPGDDPEMIKRKVQRLEHENYPKIIEEVLTTVNHI